CPSLWGVLGLVCRPPRCVGCGRVHRSVSPWSWFPSSIGLSTGTPTTAARPRACHGPGTGPAPRSTVPVSASRCQASCLVVASRRSLRGAASAPRRAPTDRRRARGRAHIRGRGVLGDDGVARQGARRGAAMRGALVTGASRGIGRAAAIALSARGEKVAVHYGRRREEAERTLAALHGDGHVLVGGDL